MRHVFLYATLLLSAITMRATSVIDDDVVITGTAQFGQLIEGMSDAIIHGDLTVDGDINLNVDSMGRISQYVSGITTYTLSSIIDFDSEEDPADFINGAPPVFVAPIRGEFLVTLRIIAQDLVLNEFILGNPVASIEIKRNGVTVLCNYQPLVASNDTYYHALAGQVHLEPGDQLSASYSILGIHEGVFTQLTGSIDLVGSGVGDQTYMSVHCLFAPQQSM